MKTRAPRSSRERRPYRQRTRALAAAETHRRILDAFVRLLLERRLDDVTLQEVADTAGVTVQTVIRRFGGKEGLLAAAVEKVAEEAPARRRDAKPGDLRDIAQRIVEDYENQGDLVVRFLEQERSQPALRPILERGRREHRAWVSTAFGPWLEKSDRSARERTTDALVTACDLYVWKLLRRDLGRSRAEVTRTIERLAAGVLGESSR